MVHSVTPIVAVGFDQVVKKDRVWFDASGRGEGGTGQYAGPQPGTTVIGNDGRLHMWVEASAAITVAASPGTQVTITAPAYTVAAGSGGWYAPTSAQYTGTIAAGDRFWVVKGTAA